MMQPPPYRKGEDMEKIETTEYETPRIEDHGDLTELTAGEATGSHLDASFPAGTPYGELTFSSS